MEEYFTKDTPVETIKYNIIQKPSQYATRISQETGISKDTLLNFSDIRSWYNIKGYWYYFKASKDPSIKFLSELYFFNELLGVEISKYFGLDTVEYEIAKLYYPKGDYRLGLMSKNFYEQGCTYKNPSEYSMFRNIDNLDILEILNKLCQQDVKYKQLLIDIKKLFISEYYTLQNDRHNMNLMFKETPVEVRLAPLYDYEMSFYDYDDSDFFYYSSVVGYFNIKDENTRKTFINDEDFQELLNKLIDLKFNDLIESIQCKYHMVFPRNFQEYYLNHDQTMKRLIKDQKLVK